LCCGAPPALLRGHPLCRCRDRRLVADSRLTPQPPPAIVVSAPISAGLFPRPRNSPEQSPWIEGLGPLQLATGATGPCEDLRGARNVDDPLGSLHVDQDGEQPLLPQSLTVDTEPVTARGASQLRNSERLGLQTL